MYYLSAKTPLLLVGVALRRLAEIVSTTGHTNTKNVPKSDYHVA